MINETRIGKTRREAKEEGLKRYFTGIPCHKGHIAERMTGDGKCTKCWFIPVDQKKNKRRNIASGLRKEAKEKGLKFYFTGIICKNDHISKRRVSSARCVKCEIEIFNPKSRAKPERKKYMKKYRLKYKDTEEGKISLQKGRKKYEESDSGAKIISTYRKSDRFKEVKKEEQKKALSTPEGKLIIYMRNRIGGALRKKQNIKHKRTLELLNCSIDFLKKYIEKKFNTTENTKGMTWDNYGEWHIDHIRPCANFDLSKEEEQKKCFNYKNLQPLWAKDNLSKNDKY